MNKLLSLNISINLYLYEKTIKNSLIKKFIIIYLGNI